MFNWEFRPPATASTAKELAPLTGAIETVLDRLQESFRQQRDFTSDAAHELKTSVAIVKSTLQTLLQRPRPEQEYRPAKPGKHAGRLWAAEEDLLGRLLRLARIEQWAENGMKSQAGASPKSLPLARRRSLEFRRWLTRAIFEIELIAPQRGSPASFDPEDLEVIWVNMLENAVQYSPAGSKVAIRVEPNGGGTACVAVQDSGPGIPARTAAACVPAILPRRSLAVSFDGRIWAGIGDLRSHGDGLWGANSGRKSGWAGNGDAGAASY